MSLPLPKIAWPAAGPANEIDFRFPPIEKPFGPTNDGDEIESVRSDSITLSGLRQCMFYRQDEFKHLILKYVDIQSEMPNWKAFIQYAQQGGSFLYYPDGLLGAYDEWLLEDSGGSNRSQSSSTSSSTNWNPKWAFWQTAEFELVMRKVPGGLSSP